MLQTISYAYIRVFVKGRIRFFVSFVKKVVTIFIRMTENSYVVLFPKKKNKNGLKHEFPLLRLF